MFIRNLSKNFQMIKVHPKMSLDGGEGSAEQAAVLRYSPEKVKKHILAFFSSSFLLILVFSFR